MYALNGSKRVHLVSQEHDENENIAACLKNRVRNQGI